MSAADGHTVLGGVLVASACVASSGILTRLVAPAGTHRPALVLALGGWIGLVAASVPESLREHGTMLVVGILAALAVGVGLALVVRERMHVLVVVGAVALPLRVPISMGTQTFSLLVGLYAVVGVGVIATILRRDGHVDGLGIWPRGWLREPERLLDLAVAMTVVLGGLSVSWALDRAAAGVKFGLFYVPFALLYVLLREHVPTVRDVARGGRALVAVMCGAAVVGIGQRATGTVWQNPKVEVANALGPVFRTNSVFWDPNIYGRYLVVALLAALAALVATRTVRGARPRAVASGAAALLALGLWLTYSQSSFLALSAGCLALALVLLPRRGRIATVCVVGALATTLAVVGARSGAIDDQGRLPIAREGLTLASFHPALGLGLGSFEAGVVELARERGGRAPRLRSSHTTPVTVLVEQGVIGVAAYLLLLVAAAAAAGEAAIGGRAAAGRAAVGAHAAATPSADDTREDPSPTEDARLLAARRWATAVVVALTVHSLVYAGYFEDPVLWVALALLAMPIARHADGAPCEAPSEAGDAALPARA